jgi:hypothetical protein
MLGLSCAAAAMGSQAIAAMAIASTAGLVCRMLPLLGLTTATNAQRHWMIDATSQD